MAISVKQIRDLTGAPEDLVKDTEITELINFVKTKTPQYFRIRTTPTKTLETIHIYDDSNVQVSKTPLLSVDKFQIGDIELNQSDISFNRIGTIRRRTRNYNRYRVLNHRREAKIKYTYGFVEEDEDTISFLNSSYTSGNNVVISVDDSSIFEANDWVKIQDYDNVDIVKIKSKNDNNNTITLDLNYDFEIDSKLSKLIEPKIIELFNKYEVCVAVALRAIGSTYTFNTSYSKGDTSVSKGVPYTHWDKSFNSNIKLRDEMNGIIQDMLITSA